jgi:catechol 2,3-dioxygenase-like lactoylglutathione lyase family enzyme
MKKALFIIGIILSPVISICQSFDFEFDHYTLQVKSMEASVEFYKNILQLKELDTPWPDNPSIRFFEIGNNQQLHLGEVDFGEVKLNKIIHLALAVNDFDAFLTHLMDIGFDYSNFSGEKLKYQTRPDGVRQIYFQDPDEYWIEVNDVKHD